MPLARPSARARLGRAVLWCGGLLLLAAVFRSSPHAAQECLDKYFDSEGVPIRYCATGTGTPVVVIHGSNGAWRGRMVEAFGPLAERHQLIGFDVRGHGKSGKPHDPDEYGPELIDDVVRLLNVLDIDRAHVVGYSMGGFIGLKLAVLYPDRIRSLTLVGQGIVTADELDQMAESPDPPDRGAEEEDRVAFAAAVKSFPALAVSDYLVRASRVPMMAIVGLQDPRVSRATRLKSVQPATRLVFVPDRDHGSIVFAPQLLPELLAFFKKVDEKERK